MCILETSLKTSVSKMVEIHDTRKNTKQRQSEKGRHTCLKHSTTVLNLNAKEGFLYSCQKLRDSTEGLGFATTQKEAVMMTVDLGNG